MKRPNQGEHPTERDVATLANEPEKCERDGEIGGRDYSIGNNRAATPMRNSTGSNNRVAGSRRSRTIELRNASTFPVRRASNAARVEIRVDVDGKRRGYFPVCNFRTHEFAWRHGVKMEISEGRPCLDSKAEMSRREMMV
jgi:hypothetical protein